MNLFLLPLWILSGALFPAEGARSWIGFLMQVNPLSYGMKAFHIIFFKPEMIQAFWLSLSIVGIAGLILFILGVQMVSKRQVRNVALVRILKKSNTLYGGAFQEF